MLALPVAQKLRGNGVLAGTFTGGIYPQSSDDDTAQLSRERFPAAFDDAATGDLLPTILVQDSTIVPYGPLPHSAMATVRVLFWQQRGRGLLDAGMVQAHQTLHNAGLAVGPLLYVYRLRFAGMTMVGADPELRDAQHGYMTFQGELLIGGS